MGGDAGDQQRLVAGMDVAIAFGRRHALASHAGIVIAGADQLHLGAKLSHRSHLARVGVLGSAHDRLHAEQPRRIRDGLAVVSGRGGDHAGLALLGGELRDEVHAASDLERAGRQMVLVLQVHVRAQHLADGRRLAKRSGGEMHPDALRRGDHIPDRWLSKRHLIQGPKSDTLRLKGRLSSDAASRARLLIRG